MSIENLSDEEFLHSEPPAVDTTEVVEPVVVEEVEPENVASTANESNTEDESDSNIVDEEVVETPDGEVEDEIEDPAKVVEPLVDPSKQKTDEPNSSVDPDTTGSETTEQVINYEEAFKEIMKPFKANGKTIELKDSKEAIQLMQMGANYTRKMQDIQPHRKALLMLENNGLLNEDKLSFLIDLDKKNPEAIKRLLKESGIDPLEIDTETESNYLEGNHKVGDSEVIFASTLEELGSNPDGKETLREINSNWDQASKEVLWKSPEIMTAIHQQRDNGIYSMITEEMDRQKVLGAIPNGTSFLQAYRAIGDQLRDNGSFDRLEANNANKNGRPTAVISAGKTAIATRAGVVKPTVTNGDKVSAASPTRSTPNAAKVLVNPLSMSDDEFLKTMDKRL